MYSYTAWPKKNRKSNRQGQKTRAQKRPKKYKVKKRKIMSMKIKENRWKTSFFEPPGKVDWKKSAKKKTRIENPPSEERPECTSDRSKYAQLHRPAKKKEHQTGKGKERSKKRPKKYKVQKNAARFFQWKPQKVGTNVVFPTTGKMACDAHKVAKEMCPKQQKKQWTGNGRMQ